MPKPIMKNVTVQREDGWSCVLCNANHKSHWKAQECERSHIKEVDLVAMPPGYDTIAFYFTSEAEMRTITANGEFEGAGWYIGRSDYLREIEDYEYWHRLEDVVKELDTHAEGIKKAQKNVREILKKK